MTWLALRRTRSAVCVVWPCPTQSGNLTARYREASRTSADFIKAVHRDDVFTPSKTLDSTRCVPGCANAGAHNGDDDGLAPVGLAAGWERDEGR
jgi:hypothetical protein